MPILIPSKNIYQVENPKVRDNVIERIEVSAVEVLPKNEYNIVVLSDRINTNENRTNKTSEELNYADSVSFFAGAIGAKIVDTYANVSIKVYKQKENSYISYIYSGIDNTVNSSQIKINKNISEKAYTYQVNNSFTMNSLYEQDYNFDFNKFNLANNSNQIHEKKVDSFGKRYVEFFASDDGTPRFANNWEVKINEEGNNQDSLLRTYLEYNIPDNYTFVVGYPNGDLNISLEESDLSALIVEEKEEYFEIKNIKVLVERKMYSCATAYWFEGTSIVGTYPSKVVQINQIANSAEITVYGDTIGIDLKDSVVHIDNGDSTSKKVFAVDGNELMQTSNYTTNPTLTKLVEGKDYSVEYFDDLDGRYPSAEGDYGVRADIWVLNDELQGSDFVARLYSPDSDTIYYDTEFKNQQYNKMVVDDGGYYIGKAELFLKDSNAISVSYKKTQEKYKTGKETATIRCSISDYYEYGKPQSIHSMTKNIKQTINVTDNVQVSFTSSVVSSTISVSLKNGKPYTVDAYVEVIYKRASGISSKATLRIKKGETTSKAIYTATNIKSIEHYSARISFDMVFSTHDKVVPMVYGVNGQDKPLSVYKDGTPKVFNVLGVEFLYDGAVWQILNLQEE